MKLVKLAIKQLFSYFLRGIDFVVSYILVNVFMLKNLYVIFVVALHVLTILTGSWKLDYLFYSLLPVIPLMLPEFLYFFYQDNKTEVDNYFSDLKKKWLNNG